MDLIIIGTILVTIIAMYFRHNPVNHGRRFIWRRFVNWFPLGMTYAFLYMARYNLAVSKNALGESMSISDFGIIFGVGTTVYGLSFLLNGPLVDKIGGKKGILLAALGASLANIGMGLAVYLYLNGRLVADLTLVFTILYALNMFFQSYGAVSIIKVKAYWFHVRERGIFGAIFGSLISMGAYFAFDWGRAIVLASKVHIQGEPTALQRAFQVMFAVDTGKTDAIWLVFFIPAVILVFWAMLDLWLIKDTPSQANFEDFDTHDASSGEMEENFTIAQLLKRIFSNPLLLTFALIEFTTGVVRNGVMQWYTTFVENTPIVNEVRDPITNAIITPKVLDPTALVFLSNWGLILCIGGIIGGFFGGIVSDKFFQSRRSPPVVFAQVIIFLACVTMALVIKTSPLIFGICCSVIACLVITTHSLMSGTAAADFGGRKATATASGIMDGFVYLGSGIQSFSIGFLATKDWVYWPIFMAPFALFGLYLAIKTWRELPEATKRYLVQVEQVSVTVTATRTRTVEVPSRD